VKTYTGIGSRSTPAEVLSIMSQVARQLAALGWILRSGAAEGADAAFERGCDEARGHKEIYIPWAGFNGSTSNLCISSPAAYLLAKTLHPAWEKCSQGAKKLHARNTQQILGSTLDTPSAAVVAWTRAGEIVGGTATALRLAHERGVRIINLGSNGRSDRGVEEIVAAVIAPATVSASSTMRNAELRS